MKKLEVMGLKYGLLTIIGEAMPKGKNRYVLCRCDCGTIKEVGLSHLRSGATTSCKCIHKRIVSRTFYIHGKSHTRIERIYRDMVRRCTSPKHKHYANYGGRSITVEWNSAAEFIQDMLASYEEHVRVYGEKDTTIERINTNGNYSKANCRWATRMEQMANTRRNRYMLYKGDLLHLSEIARRIGMSADRLRSKIKHGTIHIPPK